MTNVPYPIAPRLGRICPPMKRLDKIVPVGPFDHGVAQILKKFRCCHLLLLRERKTVPDQPISTSPKPPINLCARTCYKCLDVLRNLLHYTGEIARSHAVQAVDRHIHTLWPLISIRLKILRTEVLVASLALPSASGSKRREKLVSASIRPSRVAAPMLSWTDP